MRVLLVRDFTDTSFGRQAKLLERGLKELGHEVTPMEKSSTKREDIPPGYDWYIYYTIYGTHLFWKGIPDYNRNIVFEVADTDAVSHMVSWFFKTQPVDTIVVPSKFSRDAFFTLNNPPPQPIRIIPHALNPVMFEVKPANFPHPCVLALLPHSWERKGGDVVLDVFEKLKREGTRFFSLILTAREIRGFNRVPTPLPDPEYYSIFAGCDILFYPVRGGAFEIPVIEALALGLDVVVTGQGAWMEWVLSPDDVYPIRVRGKVRLWYSNPFHVGFFFDPDPVNALVKLKEALTNWYPEKKKENLEVRALKYRERYHYLEVAKEWESL